MLSETCKASYEDIEATTQETEVYRATTKETEVGLRLRQESEHM